MASVAPAATPPDWQFYTRPWLVGIVLSTFCFAVIVCQAASFARRAYKDRAAKAEEVVVVAVIVSCGLAYWVTQVEVTDNVLIVHGQSKPSLAMLDRSYWCVDARPLGLTLQGFRCVR